MAVTAGATPRVAYLVLSHKNPPQVEALVHRVLELSPAGEVLVHHDAKAGAVPWGGAPPARSRLVDPIPVTWGDWSVVEATLRLLRGAAEAIDADWYVFLSGEDRPVRDLAVWEQELTASGTDGLIPARALTTRPAFGRRPTAGDLNYVRYAHRWRALPEVHSHALRRLFHGLRVASVFMQPLWKIEYAERRDRWFMGVRRRLRLPPGWALYAGSQWMAVGRRSARCILDVDPAVTQWFRRTWIPDQGYFHTVLYNQPELNLRDVPVTYVVPHDSTKHQGWMTITTEDMDAIARSGAAFARKFDPDADSDVLARIDAAVDAAVDAAPRTRPPPSESYTHRDG
jgi:hypothetical protein